MTERDDRYVGNDRQSWPHNTGEFRAAQDVSASTAEFKAFAAGQPGGSGNGQPEDTGVWPEQPWDAGTTGGNNLKLWLIVGGIALIVLVVLLLLFA